MSLKRSERENGSSKVDEKKMKGTMSNSVERKENTTEKLKLLPLFL